MASLLVVCQVCGKKRLIDLDVPQSEGARGSDLADFKLNEIFPEQLQPHQDWEIYVCRKCLDEHRDMEGDPDLDKLAATLEEKRKILTLVKV